jgi:Family of unknown function (DUF6445)
VRVNGADYNFNFNEAPELRTIFVGKEENPVIIIDNMMQDPRSMIDFASSEVTFKRDTVTYYPGIRAPLPKQYANNLSSMIPSLIRDAFRPSSTKQEGISCNKFLSLSTLTPEQLEVPQRFPHTDASDHNQFAVLHYFCDPQHGGTSFYRHRESGYESISKDRVNIFSSLFNSELASNGPPPAKYINGDNSFFERTASIDSEFNRLVIYRGNMLHSGNINPELSLSNSPRDGRLTATVFFLF